MVPLCRRRAVDHAIWHDLWDHVTPDPETGIGTWSEAAFERAMQNGVARDGHFLYPAFPYDYFTHATNDDLNSLYAFLMTRQSVYRRPPANQLRFPLNVRGLMAAWDPLFLHNKPFNLNLAQGAEWNRGAYLVESRGHCGSCHTPRNAQNNAAPIFWGRGRGVACTRARRAIPNAIADATGVRVRQLPFSRPQMRAEFSS